MSSVLASKSLKRRALLRAPSTPTRRGRPSSLLALTPTYSVRHMGWFTADVAHPTSKPITKALSTKDGPVHIPIVISHEDSMWASNRDSVDQSSQYVRSGIEAREHRGEAGYGPMDAAAESLHLTSADRTRGNPEGVGMLEQVGSASATAKFFAEGGKQGFRDTLDEAFSPAAPANYDLWVHSSLYSFGRRS